MKNRIAYIDVAKGILILCLLFGHMIIELNIHGVDDEVLHGMWKLVPVYNSFFMPCFFLITGFCSTFDIPFRTYLWKNIKTLLLPAIVLTLFSSYLTDIVYYRQLSLTHIAELAGWMTTGGPWFIISLLLAKLLYWPLSRCNVRIRGIIILFIYCIGLLLNQSDILPNWLWHRHAFTLLPYIFVGDILKTYMTRIQKYTGWVALAWLILVPLQVVLHYKGVMILPTHDKFMNVTFDNCIVHIINVLLGTGMIFYVSNWISIRCKSGILQTFGKGTLLIYLVNEPQQRFVLRIMMPFYDPAFNIFQSFIFQCATHFLCFLIFYIVVKTVYDSKYLSAIVGKW